MGRGQRHRREAVRLEERGHLRRPHTERVREPAGYRVLEHAVVEQPVDEGRIGQLPALVGKGEQASDGAVARHERDRDERAGAGDAGQLVRGADPVGRLGQVVHRAEGQHRVEGAVGPARQVAGVDLHHLLHRAGGQGRLRDRQQLGGQVGQRHVPAELGQPDRVRAGAAAEVERPPGPAEVRFEQARGQHPLEEALGGEEPVVLVLAARRVVRPHRRRVHQGRRISASTPQPRYGRWFVT